MNQEEWDGLIGQLQAEVTVLNALIATLIARDPALKADLLAMVEVAALSSGSKAGPQLPYFQEQLAGWRHAIQSA